MTTRRTPVAHEDQVPNDRGLCCNPVPTIDVNAALRQLLDRAAIHDVLRRYARGVDTRDFDLVASCFTPDAAYQGSLAQTNIRDALATLRQSLDRYSSTMHFMGNQLIELQGDRATSETYAIAYHRLAAVQPATNFVVAVRYLDGLVRSSDSWLICRRVAKLEWQRNELLLETRPNSDK